MLVIRVGRADTGAGGGGVWQKEGVVGLKERPGVVGGEVDLPAAVDGSLAESCKEKRIDDRIARASYLLDV